MAPDALYVEERARRAAKKKKKIFLSLDKIYRVERLLYFKMHYRLSILTREERVLVSRLLAFLGAFIIFEQRIRKNFLVATSIHNTHLGHDFNYFVRG